MVQDLGVRGVVGRPVQSPVAVGAKPVNGPALDQGALASPSKPGAAAQVYVQPVIPGDSGDHGAHAQLLVVMDVVHAPGVVRAVVAWEPGPKPSSVILDHVQQCPVDGVLGAVGPHALPLVEEVFSFGPENACPAAGLEPVMS